MVRAILMKNAGLSAVIEKNPIDVALVGIGENGHLGFNDPPADFETDLPFIVVALDEDCRKQRSWRRLFNTMEDVPHRAITMSIKQIIKSKEIICSVPDLRKAKAVKNCLEGPESNLYPQVFCNCMRIAPASWTVLRFAADSWKIYKLAFLLTVKLNATVHPGKITCTSHLS